MGRKITLGDYQHVSLTIHPLLQFSLLMAGMAATIAMITALCGVRFGRKSTAPDDASDDQKVKASDKKTDVNNNNNNVSVHNDGTSKHNKGDPMETTTTTTPTPEVLDSENPQMKELPLPPALQPSISCRNLPRSLSRCTSTRKLDFSLSVKMPRSFSVRRIQEHRRKAKLQKEDSIWTKTIILGEKCRVPDDDDDAILYDNNGNRISAYHKKTQSTLSLSRTNSVIDPTAVLGHQDRDQKRKDQELSPDNLNNQGG